MVFKALRKVGSLRSLLATLKNFTSVFPLFHTSITEKPRLTSENFENLPGRIRVVKAPEPLTITGSVSELHEAGYILRGELHPQS